MHGGLVSNAVATGFGAIIDAVIKKLLAPYVTERIHTLVKEFGSSHVSEILLREDPALVSTLFPRSHENGVEVVVVAVKGFRQPTFSVLRYIIGGVGRADHELTRWTGKVKASVRNRMRDE